MNITTKQYLNLLLIGIISFTATFFLPKPLQEAEIVIVLFIQWIALFAMFLYGVFQPIKLLYSLMWYGHADILKELHPELYDKKAILLKTGKFLVRFFALFTLYIVLALAYQH